MPKASPQPIDKLTPGLWVAQSRVYATNSGVWLRDGAACLVDPAVLLDEVERIAALVADQHARPLYLVFTHGHWDHVLGARVFPAAPIVAHSAYLDELERHGRYNLAFLVAQKLVPGDGSFALPRPDVLVPQATSLAVGGLVLHLLPTPGHAPDHLSIFEPETGTLWAGDMLSDVEMPSVLYSLVAYERSLESLAALDVRALVPGHGAPTLDEAEARRRLQADRDYLAALRAAVEAALSGGWPVDEAVARSAGMAEPYPGYEDTHRFNVEGAYVELGGPGNPAELGWEKVFAAMAGAGDEPGV